MEEGDAIRLRMTGLGGGGDCLGRPEGEPDGESYFVAFAVPGDVVLAEPDRSGARKGKGPARASLLEVIEASADRVKPHCLHFGRCGGCQWQHVSYRAQLEAKHALVRRAVSAAGTALDATVRPVEASPLPYGYRHRTTLSVCSVRGKVLCGFRWMRSHRIVDLSECPVLAGPLETALPVLRDRAARALSRKTGAADLHAILDQEGRVLACLTVDADRPRQAARTVFIEVADGRAKDIHEARGVYRIEGIGIGAAPGVFAQANLLANEGLVREVMVRLEAAAPGSLLDLYCGAGNYALPAARRVAEVHGIEQAVKAVEMASRTARASGLSRVTFAALEVRMALEGLVRRGRHFDAVICNPPRSGLDPGVAEGILAVQPETVIYVSCSPRTLGRDLRKFQGGGYRIESIRPFDLFPQTFHVETVTTLTKGK